MKDKNKRQKAARKKVLQRRAKLHDIAQEAERAMMRPRIKGTPIRNEHQRIANDINRITSLPLKDEIVNREMAQVNLEKLTKMLSDFDSEEENRNKRKDEWHHERSE